MSQVGKVEGKMLAMGYSSNWQWQLACWRVIMGAAVLVVEPCQPCFDLRPRRLRRLRVGPAKSRWLTQRAADGGYVPHFRAGFWLETFPF